MPIRPEKRDAARRAIAEAFAGFDPPGDDALLHPQCMDDGDIAEFYGCPDPGALDGAMLVRNYAAPAFFSAAAFRHYMPAFMRWSLDHPDSSEYVVEATIRAFDPGGPADELYPFLVSKFALFDTAQRRAVTLFLDAFADDDELGGLARAALRNHWYGAGDTVPAER